MILARTPRALILAAPLLAAAVLAMPLAAAAKTLVYCSEGNPEALNPQLVTTTTGVTAGNRTAAPVRTLNRPPWRGHSTSSPCKDPSPRDASAWEQRSSIA